MMHPRDDVRRGIVCAAREVLAGSRRISDFVALARATGDPDVERLADLIAQEPAAANRCGIGGLAHRQHPDKIECAIQIMDESR